MEEIGLREVKWFRLKVVVVGSSVDLKELERRGYCFVEVKLWDLLVFWKGAGGRNVSNLVMILSYG